MAEGNPERGELTIVVDGQGYVLKLTMKALVALQKKTGKKFGEVLRDVQQLDIVALQQLIGSMLQAHHAQDFKTEDSVYDFIEKAGGLAAIKFVGDALEVAMAQSAGDKADPQ